MNSALRAGLSSIPSTHNWGSTNNSSSKVINIPGFLGHCTPTYIQFFLKQIALKVVLQYKLKVKV